jgi:Mn-dependent DtxR family transcriptional regulator
MQLLDAIKKTYKFAEKQKKILEIIYKTSINNKSDVPIKIIGTKAGCTKAYVYIFLKELQKDGYVSLEGKNIILNQEELNKLIESTNLIDKL